MNYLKISLGILAALAASRFLPHHPNFTSLLALSFYVPALLGLKFIPILILGFVLTDLVIGFHDVTLFTWGSILFIGLFSKYLSSNFMYRISGSLLGAFAFFIITNFGVWSLGYYEYSVNGLINCYYMAIPFFTYSLISTLIFSAIIETIYKYRFLLLHAKK